MSKQQKSFKDELNQSRAIKGNGADFAEVGEIKEKGFTCYVPETDLDTIRALANYFKLTFKDYIQQILKDEIAHQPKEYVEEAIAIFREPEVKRRTRRSRV